MVNLPSLVCKIQLARINLSQDPNFKTYFIIIHLANENVFISPSSISKLMLMCLAGAKTGSTTSDFLKQILNLTHFKDEQILDLVAESIARLDDALSPNEDFLLLEVNKIYLNRERRINSSLSMKL